MTTTSPILDYQKNRLLVSSDTNNILPAGTSYNYGPQTDITTYELAICLPVIMAAVQGRSWAAELAEKLPPEAKRHFKVVNSPNG